jgi:predicted PurR-regulated permease PerM
MFDTPPPRRRIELTIAWVTLLKLFAACLIAYMLIRLWPLLELLILSLLIAITLFPVMGWTRRRGWPDWVAVTASALLLIGLVALFAAILVPTLGNQGENLIKSLPELQKEVVARVPSPSMRDAINKLFESASFSNPEPLMKHFIAWGKTVVWGLGEFFLVLVVAIYFLADGERVNRWLIAFLPETHRQKVSAASSEIGTVVSSYMLGQLITSLLCAVYTGVMLTVLHVPNAVLLAVIAGVFDILPLVGFFLSVIPAFIVATSVSATTAWMVLLLYGAYHVAENYLIVPKVYGNQLRLSTLTVLVSCMAAAMLAGIVGAIVVLPIVASYPIVERLWLKRRLEPDTVAKHERIDAEEHPA